MTVTMPHSTIQEEQSPIHILWINCGLSCDGESVALTAATQPSIEEIALGALPGLPQIALHWPFIDFECGPDQGADAFIEWLEPRRQKARATAPSSGNFASSP